MRFGMPGLGINLNFAYFDPKIGFHGKVPWAIGKGGQIGNLRSNAYHMVKIWLKFDENRLEGSVKNTERSLRKQNI